MNRIGNLIAVFFPYEEMAFNVSRASVCGFFCKINMEHIQCKERKYWYCSQLDWAILENCHELKCVFLI